MSDTERDLLDQMLVQYRARTRKNMTRSQFAEARHWLLYAGQECHSLREELARWDDLDWAKFILSLDPIIAQLQALRAYILGDGPAPVHPNELAGAGAPPAGVVMADQTAGRTER